MTIRLISDLHLEPARPAQAMGFLNYLSDLPDDTESLYILGDFFEVWMGDDYSDEFSNRIREAIKATTTRGIDVFFMHGNRDFLVGQQFCEQTGAHLVDDPTVTTLNGQPVLLMHGDSLCTDDTEYMKIRGMFRNPAWQQDFLSKPLAERIAFARQVRSESQSSHQMKSAEIMDVNQQEVDRTMAEFGQSILIHGHTHRPEVHSWDHNGEQRTRIVLGDWSDSEGWEVVIASDGKAQLQKFSLKTD